MTLIGKMVERVASLRIVPRRRHCWDRETALLCVLLSPESSSTVVSDEQTFKPSSPRAPYPVRLP